MTSQPSFRLTVVVAALLLACSGSKRPIPECSTDVDCAVGKVCADGGTCDAASALTIHVVPLAESVKGVPYPATPVQVSGGAQPYFFTLGQVPSELSWLRINTGSGVLSGTPDEAFSPAATFQIGVSDRSRQQAAASFQLLVGLCADGQQVPCFEPASGTTCGTGTTTCDGGAPGVCVVTGLSSSAANCGATCGSCGSSGDSCANGACACGGHGSCDADGGLGCCSNNVGATSCVDLQNDPNNCGQCGNACPAVAHQTPSCVQGQCSSTNTCSAGYSACDPNNPNSCSTNVRADINNCGSCGNRCNAAGVVADACTNGLCVCGGQTECVLGTETCCEANAFADAGCNDPMTGARADGGINRCGGCASAFCSDPTGYGAAICDAGACGALCGRDSQGHQYEDCSADGGIPTHCTTDISTDIKHCGGCGPSFACPSIAGTGSGTVSCTNELCGYGCSAGSCAPNGTAYTCNDERNAGSCGSSCQQCTNYATAANSSSAGPLCCPAGTNANGECLGSCTTNPDSCHCGLTCKSGWGNCDGDPSNGCEKSLTNDPNNCGGCKVACGAPGANADAGCNGACYDVCNAGSKQCPPNTTYGSGCTVVMGSDINNCGDCNVQCSGPTNGNGFPVCNSGSCGIGCNSGYCPVGTQCSNNQTDPKNCGSCGNVCPASNFCDKGQCCYHQTCGGVGITCCDPTGCC